MIWHVEVLLPVFCMEGFFLSRGSQIAQTKELCGEEIGVLLPLDSCTLLLSSFPICCHWSCDWAFLFICLFILLLKYLSTCSYTTKERC